jgi:hypothetical protein
MWHPHTVAQLYGLRQRILSVFKTLFYTRISFKILKLSNRPSHSGKTPGNNFFLKTFFIFYISIFNVWGDTADSKILEFWIKFSKIGPW